MADVKPLRTKLIQRKIADYVHSRAVEILTMFNRFLIDVVSQYE